MPRRPLPRLALHGTIALWATGLILTGCAAPAGPADPSPPSPSIDSPGDETAPLAALDAEGLASLQGVRVFFAHRSVGADVVELGIPAVYDDFAVDPPEIVAGGPSAEGTFGDQWLIQTDDPADKLQDFDDWVRERGVGEAADIALMKIGYIDITEDTDVDALFEEYRSMMDALEADYPQVVFLHATVSVTGWVPGNNVEIESLNALLREQYASSGRLFDLGEVVSTCSDGVRERHETGQGGVYYQLCEEYTRDGGHLNELGAEVAAAELLRLLVSVVPGR
jgi:hypothetical protein